MLLQHGYCSSEAEWASVLWPADCNLEVGPSDLRCRAFEHNFCHCRYLTPWEEESFNLVKACYDWSGSHAKPMISSDDFPSETYSASC